MCRPASGISMWRLMARRGSGPTPAADLSLSLVFLRDRTKSRLRPSTQTISLWVKANHSAQQQCTYYDARGNSLGRSIPDSQGTVTNTDARGKVISREFTSGNVTTIYDAGGRNVGRVTTSPPR